SVRFEFVADPEGFELGPFTSHQHCWSARIYERLCELYPTDGPDLVEFNDYLGEGFVTIQARRSGHPSLRSTHVAVRLHTSLEMIDALDGVTEPDEERRAIYTLERGSLAFADELRCPVAEVDDAYVRFYGESNLAPRTIVPNVVEETETAAVSAAPEGRTRLLYVGRLQHAKGVAELVEAATRIEREDWELTLLGRDTDTAPGGGSMREHLSKLASGHKRIHFRDEVPIEQVLGLIDEHHAVVIPSHWECWSSVAREALSRNRPVLAAPRGGLIEAVKAGVSGWLMGGATTEDVQRAMELVLDSRTEIDRMIESHGPLERLNELVRPDQTIEHYRGGGEAPTIADPANVSVTALVVCSSGAGNVVATLASLARQERPPDELLLVCDGFEHLPMHFDPSAADLLKLMPAGAGPEACRNAGLDAASGDCVWMIDAGSEVDPTLLARLLAALALNPRAAYATAWGSMPDPSAVPLGNYANFVPEHDNAAVAPLVRREVLEHGHRFEPARGACAGRSFWAALAVDGLHGCVVPERLVSWAPFSGACADGTLSALAEQARLQRGEPASWLAP
ncbi:MAG TPA: glycosyltransferase, partial [Thermoleophilaceae bacterium]